MTSAPNAHGVPDPAVLCLRRFESVFDMHQVRTGSPEALHEFRDKLERDAYFAMDFWALVDAAPQQGRMSLSRHKALDTAIRCVSGPDLADDDPRASTMHTALEALAPLSNAPSSALSAAPSDSKATSSRGLDGVFGARSDGIIEPKSSSGLPEETACDPIDEVTDHATSSVDRNVDREFESGSTPYQGNRQIDEALSRLEISGHELRLHLGEIESKMERIEPHLEHLTSRLRDSWRKPKTGQEPELQRQDIEPSPVLRPDSSTTAPPEMPLPGPSVPSASEGTTEASSGPETPADDNRTPFRAWFAAKARPAASPARSGLSSSPRRLRLASGAGAETSGAMGAEAGRGDQQNGSSRLPRGLDRRKAWIAAVPVLLALCGGAMILLHQGGATSDVHGPSLEQRSAQTMPRTLNFPADPTLPPSLQPGISQTSTRSGASTAQSGRRVQNGGSPAAGSYAKPSAGSQKTFGPSPSEGKGPGATDLGGQGAGIQEAAGRTAEEDGLQAENTGLGTSEPRPANAGSASARSLDHRGSSAFAPDLGHGTPGRANLVTVSSGVMAANLIASTPPHYPRMAGLTHLQGSVVLQAIISKHGTVESVHVIKGHYLLRGAASNAVRSWRYRPYLLNGHAVEVATIVTVDFMRK